MMIQVALVGRILKSQIILFEELDVTIMLLCDAQGKYFHPKKHVDADDLIICEFNGALRIVSMVKLVNAAE
jgi:hypothetical protein